MGVNGGKWAEVGGTWRRLKGLHAVHGSHRGGGYQPAGSPSRWLSSSEENEARLWVLRCIMPAELDSSLVGTTPN